jgi:hypothetical protein
VLIGNNLQVLVLPLWILTDMGLIQVLLRKTFSLFVWMVVLLGLHVLRIHLFFTDMKILIHERNLAFFFYVTFSLTRSSLPLEYIFFRKVCLLFPFLAGLYRTSFLIFHCRLVHSFIIFYLDIAPREFWSHIKLFSSYQHQAADLTFIFVLSVFTVFFFNNKAVCIAHVTKKYFMLEDRPFFMFLEVK